LTTWTKSASRQVVALHRSVRKRRFNRQPARGRNTGQSMVHGEENRNRAIRSGLLARVFFPLEPRKGSRPVRGATARMIAHGRFPGKRRMRRGPKDGRSTQSTQSTKSGISPYAFGKSGGARFRRLRRGVDCVENCRAAKRRASDRRGSGAWRDPATRTDAVRGVTVSP